MPQITMAEWDRLMAAGETTYAIGPVAGRVAVYANQVEAEEAAAEGDGTFIQWDGAHGHQVTVPECDVEPEAGR